MVAMQWQGGVLSLLDQGAYPQEEKWLTCNTWGETAQALATPAVQEEKVAAIAAAYGYAQAAIAAQDKLGTDAFQAALDQAKKTLLASRPGSRDVAAALAFVETPPEAYTKTPTNSPPFWPLRSPLTASRWWPTGTSAATAPT